MVDSRIFGTSEIQIVFRESLNTASFVLARDNNDDGDVDDPFDTPGSLLLVDGDGNVLDELGVDLGLGNDGLEDVSEHLFRAALCETALLRLLFSK